MRRKEALRRADRPPRAIERADRLPTPPTASANLLGERSPAAPRRTSTSVAGAIAHAWIGRPALDCATAFNHCGPCGSTGHRDRAPLPLQEHHLGNQLEQPNHCGCQTHWSTWQPIGGWLCVAPGRRIRCLELERGRHPPPGADGTGPRLAAGSGRFVARPGPSRNNPALHRQPVLRQARGTVRPTTHAAGNGGLGTSPQRTRRFVGNQVAGRSSVRN